jgi:hypothetical protein
VVAATAVAVAVAGLWAVLTDLGFSSASSPPASPPAIEKTRAEPALQPGPAIGQTPAAPIVAPATSSPTSTAIPGDEAGYRRQENVSWGLQPHTSCSLDGSWYSYDLDAIGLTGEEGDGEFDVEYDCEWNMGSIKPLEGAVGILEKGEVHTLSVCRNAAMANPHPVNFNASAKSQREAGIVIGGALCVITSQGRVLLLRIDKIIAGRGEMPAPTIGGRAIIWDPQ